MVNINNPETVTQQWSQPLIELSELLLIMAMSSLTMEFFNTF